jgi:hypothetical protein
MSNIASFWSNWERGHVALEPDAAWLGSAGWTIPLWADPRIVRRLRHAPGNLNAAFVRRYTKQNAEQLRKLWGRLLTSRGMRRWRVLLSEAIASYEDRRYAIVVPALLLVVEGSVSTAAGVLKSRSPLRRSAAVKRGTTPAGMRRLIWVSIESFVQSVFGDAPFDAMRPINLNRHWVLHGREANAWGRRRECIRLFHALDTISATVDRFR